jgi:pimeloyl-ACP methyl ester carboxylesterase
MRSKGFVVMSVPRKTNVTGDVAIVLVHGACHGSWCWEEIVGPLSDRGWIVRTVDMPLTSLRDDAEVVRDAVRDAKGLADKVLLVGHSYGGVVISEAGHEADHIVYCAATMPDPGESAMDILPRLETPELTNALDLSEDGTTASIDPVRGMPAFYNLCPADTTSRAVGRLRPIHIACMTEAVSRPAWQEVPSSYVLCTEDFAMNPFYQRERAERLGDYIVLKTDHSLFYTATAELIENLDERAAKLRGTAMIPS